MNNFILMSVLLSLSQIQSRYIQPKSNPSQNSVINENSNQRLKDKRYYRSNDYNNLPIDDYDNFGAGMDQSQLDYDLDYGASRINEGDSRLINSRYKKGTFDNHEYSNVEAHWNPAMPRDYPFGESKSLSKRSSEENTGIQASSALASANSKSDSAPKGEASSEVAEKREDKLSPSKEEQKTSKLTSSNGATKNEEAGVALKQPPSEDVKRSSREAKEIEGEGEPDEPESAADLVWYDEEENSDLDEPKSKKKKAQMLEDILAPGDENNSDSLSPHLSIRKRNIPDPRPRRRLVEEYNNYGYDDEDEMGPKKRHRAIESNYDELESDYMFDYEDQRPVRRKRFIKREI